MLPINITLVMFTVYLTALCSVPYSPSLGKERRFGGFVYFKVSSATENKLLVLENFSIQISVKVYLHRFYFCFLFNELWNQIKIPSSSFLYNSLDGRHHILVRNGLRCIPCLQQLRRYFTVNWRELCPTSQILRKNEPLWVWLTVDGPWCGIFEGY